MDQIFFITHSFNFLKSRKNWLLKIFHMLISVFCHRLGSKIQINTSFLLFLYLSVQSIILPSEPLIFVETQISARLRKAATSITELMWKLPVIVDLRPPITCLYVHLLFVAFMALGSLDSIQPKVICSTWLFVGAERVVRFAKISFTQFTNHNTA